MNAKIYPVICLIDLPDDCLREIFRHIWWFYLSISLTCKRFAALLSGKENIMNLAVMNDKIMQFLNAISIQKKGFITGKYSDNAALLGSRWLFSDDEFFNILKTLVRIFRMEENLKSLKLDLFENIKEEYVFNYIHNRFRGECSLNEQKITIDTNTVFYTTKYMEKIFLKHSYLAAIFDCLYVWKKSVEYTKTSLALVLPHDAEVIEYMKYICLDDKFKEYNFTAFLLEERLVEMIKEGVNISDHFYIEYITNIIRPLIVQNLTSIKNGKYTREDDKIFINIDCDTDEIYEIPEKIIDLVMLKCCGF